mmetsp:Transcript_88746/g.228918  ORF Transcript_88746/g.228918 Transcript_88746/m.228918 type:complete len:247 (+) Transcript_88746:897-1637(+)
MGVRLLRRRGRPQLSGRGRTAPGGRELPGHCAAGHGGQLLEPHAQGRARAPPRPARGLAAVRAAGEHKPAAAAAAPAALPGQPRGRAGRRRLPHRLHVGRARVRAAARPLAADLRNRAPEAGDPLACGGQRDTVPPRRLVGVQRRPGQDGGGVPETGETKGGASRRPRGGLLQRLPRRLRRRADPAVRGAGAGREPHVPRHELLERRHARRREPGDSGAAPGWLPLAAPIFQKSLEGVPRCTEDAS